MAFFFSSRSCFRVRCERKGMQQGHTFLLLCVCLIFIIFYFILYYIIIIIIIFSLLDFAHTGKAGGRAGEGRKGKEISTRLVMVVGAAVSDCRAGTTVALYRCIMGACDMLACAVM